LSGQRGYAPALQGPRGTGTRPRGAVGRLQGYVEGGVEPGDASSAGRFLL
jgi:hypothetical protein